MVQVVWDREWLVVPCLRGGGLGLGGLLAVERGINVVMSIIGFLESYFGGIISVN